MKEFIRKSVIVMCVFVVFLVFLNVLLYLTGSDNFQAIMALSLFVVLGFVLFAMLIGIIAPGEEPPEKKPTPPDPTQTVQFLAKVHSKRAKLSSTGKEFHYCVTFLTPDRSLWDINLPKQQYDSIKKGDGVVVEQKGKEIRIVGKHRL